MQEDGFTTENYEKSEYLEQSLKEVWLRMDLRSNGIQR